MLSKVAERVYWLARYIERVENTARLAKVHSQLMLDLPKSVKLSWYGLVQITSNEDYFALHYDSRSEQNCMKMLLSDRNNPASLISSLWWARENIRTTRDILPREAWIHINELYVMVKNHQEDFATRTKRNELLSKIIRSCQAYTGMLEGTMSHNETYRFLKLGMLIERADMTTRLIDEGGLFVAQEVFENDDESYFDAILWANLLRSINAYFMYRQQYQTEISGQEVLQFLTQDEEFARSISYCLNEMCWFMRKLPNPEPMQNALKSLQQKISAEQKLIIGSNELHNHLDWIQKELSQINRLLYSTWFNPKQVA
ncbi:alpha-E domain-containing protein [Thiomicrorhabdus sp. 6S3-12]|uniref:alpha-E domain-containing protein n=1 Tax=Thiomicrorhabdus sp. 6S3-12 TaxID=2819681 RepID=UPI001AACD1DD|nr:alpha-E domain-containing protein [Thiomicrorhabdus sp. 6S3-12]MBO1924666.1 alpha-E domain-containing protein [Thiomicrorhabdus sp. 6S3-12]